eukprot:396466-Pleurochrysis_carterae.AAC.1
MRAQEERAEKLQSVDGKFGGDCTSRPHANAACSNVVSRPRSWTTLSDMQKPPEANSIRLPAPTVHPLSAETGETSNKPLRAIWRNAIQTSRC